jgi:hypothetical protein
MQLFIQYQIPTDLLSSDAQAQGGQCQGEASAADILVAFQTTQHMLLSAKEVEWAEWRFQRNYGSYSLGKSFVPEYERGRSCERDIVRRIRIKHIPNRDGTGFAYGAPPSPPAMVSPILIYSAAPARAEVAFRSSGPSAERQRCAPPAASAPRTSMRQSAPVQNSISSPKPLTSSVAAPAPAPAPAAPRDDQMEYMVIPKLLEEAFDLDSSLCRTIINPGATWEKALSYQDPDHRHGDDVGKRKATVFVLFVVLTSFFCCELGVALESMLLLQVLLSALLLMVAMVWACDKACRISPPMFTPGAVARRLSYCKARIKGAPRSCPVGTQGK